jgi:hypothetical protein
VVFFDENFKQLTDDLKRRQFDENISKIMVNEDYH